MHSSQVWGWDTVWGWGRVLGWHPVLVWDRVLGMGQGPGVGQGPGWDRLWVWDGIQVWDGVLGWVRVWDRLLPQGVQGRAATASAGTRHPTRPCHLQNGAGKHRAPKQEKKKAIRDI